MEYLDWLSHVLVGVLAAIASVLVHRAWSRRAWRRASAGERSGLQRISTSSKENEQ